MMRAPSGLLAVFLSAGFSSAGAVVLWALASVGNAAGPADGGARPPFFESDIRPIFREFCFDCHGATDKLEGNLDLRLVRFLRRGGDSGAAVDAERPADSLLLEKIVTGDMPPGEAHVPAEKVELLREWLTAGAPTLRPEPESIGPGVPISVEERSYWAYQPISRPPLPDLSVDVPAQSKATRNDLASADGTPAGETTEVGTAAAVLAGDAYHTAGNRSPIDVFLRAAMPASLGFAAEASRGTLIRRAYFDLTGLPPTDDELVRWLEHPSQGWFEAMVDTLLESPHYGERWARHWLDVAGYADSDGYTVADADRPWAWKYRDYVVRALNSDKPFDRFVAEQLAGDELAGVKQGDWTPEQIDLLTATGFLRTAADGTGSGDNSPDARNKVIADMLKIVGNTFLGTSLNCAQCHDHRYDPVSQLDYTAIRSVFEPAFDWQQWRIPAQRLVSLYTEADRALAAEVEAEAQRLVSEKNAKQAEYMQQALDKELMKYEEPLRDELRAAYQAAEKDRTPEQKELLAKHPSVNISPGVLYQYLPAAAEELKKFDGRITEVRSKKPVEEFVSALTEEAGRAPLAKLFYRGEHQQPKDDVHPAGLTVTAPEGELIRFAVDDEALPTSGRRLAFARWLTAPSNPLVARVIVNRVWMHHFGRAIVATPGDFGKLGSPPTHPELLDWLASEFIDSGWSMKHLHRTIMLSAAWRQSSTREPEAMALDPDNRYYSRRQLQRLEAEIIRDRMLAATGSLDRKPFGPPVAIKEDETGQVIVADAQTRRSLYIRSKRTQPVAMLQSFDAPVMEINCEARPASTVATQSLIMLNGEFTLDQAHRLAERAIREAQPLDGQRTLGLPAIPPAPASFWSYGTGTFDTETQSVSEFTSLPHWTGTQWQGGEVLPDSAIGWAFLSAQGGHPGNPQFAVVRRWSAPGAGQVTVAGKLSHGSEHGDGVRGRLVSTARGLIAEWTIHNGVIDTPAEALAVADGEAFDFIVDCQSSETSDSFGWPVQLQFTSNASTSAGGSSVRVFDSAGQFHGPFGPSADLPPQIARAWQLALSREPTADELRLAMEFAVGQLEELHHAPRGVLSGSSPERQVLVNLCQMLFSCNEFLYID
jgi:hypothetical protein